LFLAGVILACAQATLRVSVRAQGAPAKERTPPAPGEITSQLELAVARGFKLLAERAEKSGEIDPEVPVAAGALAGLAFLAGGHSERPGGVHTESVRKLTTALLKRQTSSGYFDDATSLMYGHGFATLYLAELYGTSTYRQEEIRQALKKAIAVIEGSQAEGGGWDYDPAKQFGVVRRSSGLGDTSITVCQTMALRAARNLGLATNARVVERAKAYIQRAQTEDGGFVYRPDRKSLPTLAALQGSAFPRSAAGVCILYSLGDYNTESLRRGFRYLDREYRLPATNVFPYYSHYYCAQAMYQAGGSRWKEYFAWVRAMLLERQEADGSWPGGKHENSMQATAMALIVLQLPYGFLPILER
jgi:hypothetical protein